MSKGEGTSRVGETDVRGTIDALLDAHARVTAGEVALAAGVTRQAAHYHLARMVREGEIELVGRGRGAHYRRLVVCANRYPLAGLSEDAVWLAERRALELAGAEEFSLPNVQRILAFAFTEMVNNAIEHSSGRTLLVRWYRNDALLGFEVEDDGRGIFSTLREMRGLPSDVDALVELSKGKQTIDPVHHSGLGVFLTSRLVDRFFVASGSLSWTVDNIRSDVASGWLPSPRAGTLVRCDVRPDSQRTLADVTREMSNPTSGRLDRTVVHLRLFDTGAGFVSRTEARRVGENLEGFGVIEVDFAGVAQVGQGFADELFRVWVAAHPTQRLVPTHMNPAVSAVIRAYTPTEPLE